MLTATDKETADRPGLVIDTHSQLGLAAEKLPPAMLEGYRRAFGRVPSSFSLENIIEDMERAGVDKSVVVGLDAETTFDYRVANEVVAEAVAKHPARFIGFAGADPHKGKVAVKELKRAVEELGLRGLKLLPHLHQLFPNDPMYYPLYEQAEALNLPVLFHAGNQFHQGTRLKYCRPIYLDDIAVDFPELKIIIAHFGWPWLEETLAIVQRHPNVYFNLAGWPPRYFPPQLIGYLNGPAQDKALFGSDYPLIKRERFLKELEGLPLKPEVKRKLLVTNPAKLLGI